MLPEDLILRLQPERTAGATNGTGRFGPMPPAEVQQSREVRIYLLVAAPALERDGVAVQADLGPGRRLHRYWMETVRCRLLPLDASCGAGDRGTLRNRLAYRCFGFSGTAALLDPEAAAVDQLAALVDPRTPLLDSDLPLALIAWDQDGLCFVDQWSVRRRLHPRAALPWPLGGIMDYEAVSEAMILQFLDQAQELAGAAESRTIVAARAFRYLPPVAWLPVAGGFVLDAFLEGLSVAKVDEDPAGLALWLREAQYAAPVDLNRPVPLAICAQPGSRYAVLARADLPPVWVRTSQASAAVLVELNLLEGQPLVPAEVQVYASDRRGRAWPGTYAGRRFAIAELPAGEYTVWAAYKGCRPVGQRITYAAGTTEVVTLAPRPAQAVTAGVAPGNHSGPLDWTEPPFSGYLEMKPEHIQAGVLPPETESWVWIDPAGAGLDGWFGRWAVWLMARSADLPVDPGNIRLLVAPEISGGAGLAYALVVFGDGGAYLPAVAVSIKPQAEEPPLVEPERADLLRMIVPGQAAAAGLQEGSRKQRNRGWLARAWAGLKKALGGQG